jgi:CDP-glucose 4,6-dehydratase
MFDFYKNKVIFITGHTGFKGSWLCKILSMAGARVTGYALKPPTNPSLFEIAGIKNNITSVKGDIRNFEELFSTFQKAEPEIVFHLAAQPIVRESYQNPVYTYETNVMGTVNILECVRKAGSVKSFINVTTDKVYANKEWEWGYRETDELNGFDPYSNSKSCSELATDSYRKSFFSDNQVAISTVRAGNVIGGGDFAEDRIIPDCVRAAAIGKPIIVRNPASVRPFQHVLESNISYMKIAMEQYKYAEKAGVYNIGPEYNDCITAGEIANLFCREWGDDANWETFGSNKSEPYEAKLLKLDCSRVKAVFGINPVWNVSTAIKKTVEWTKEYINGYNTNMCMGKQISEFAQLFHEGK